MIHSMAANAIHTHILKRTTSVPPRLHQTTRRATRTSRNVVSTMDILNHFVNWSFSLWGLLGRSFLCPRDFRISRLAWPCGVIAGLTRRTTMKFVWATHSLRRNKSLVFTCWTIFKEIKNIFLHFISWWWRWLKSLLMENKGAFILHGQYHGGRWPGSMRVRASATM